MRSPTWLLAVSPMVSIALLASTALHVRWTFGGWPTDAVDHPPTLLLALHEFIAVVGYGLCPFVAAPVWALLLFFRRQRLTLSAHVLQGLVLTSGLVLMACLPAVVPARYVTWLLD